MHSVLHIVEDGVQNYFASYYKFWETEGSNTAFHIENCLKRRPLIIQRVSNILKDRFPFMEYCSTPKH